ncbi:RusA family crossover junction endodeoxyribonuclease [Lysinibacillus sphaericus]|uniref:RusA family crossover junction endodeoxyribonuclease n=1 Tax=Lysinibacillus sphaericus TaxID=1421 RepID=UPI0019110E5A|nr:RusA family crossover junction endodeoxyribonuclease [Lysinibacillus sphaericus]QPA56290.1 RusA family crossover junction endodeoxyribonuclease [Lysinibacillus sphaericus]
MNVLKIEIPGVIQPQERPRFSRRGKNVVTHDAPKSKDFKDFVKLVAWQNKPSELITGPIKLQADIYIMPPKKYHTGPKRALIASGELRPTTKPDADNLIKGIKDGMSKIIWHDDAQIVELNVRKFYSEQPRAEVTIEWHQK